MEANSNCTADIDVLPQSIIVLIGKDFKQGDTISPNIFNAYLKMVIWNIDWKSGVNINGGESSHGVVANMLDCDIVGSLNFSHAIMFTFRLVLLRKVWTLLSLAIG